MALIFLKGLDRSGKTTQVEHLVTTLNSIEAPVAQYRFPRRDNTELGQKIAKFLSRKIHLSPTEAYELFVEQRHRAKIEMDSLLKHGTVLVVDRYSASGVAYGTASGLGIEWCISKEQGLLKPDLTIFLDIPIAVAMTRGGFGKEKFETVAFQKAVAITYFSYILYVVLILYYVFYCG